MADKKCPNCGACKECGAGGYKPQPIPWGVYPYPYAQPYRGPIYVQPLRWQYTSVGSAINTTGGFTQQFNNSVTPQI